MTQQKKGYMPTCTLLAKEARLAIELSDSYINVVYVKILMSCLPYQWYVYIMHMPTTIIQQRAPSATHAVAASRGTTRLENVKGFQKLLHFV